MTSLKSLRRSFNLNPTHVEFFLFIQFRERFPMDTYVGGCNSRKLSYREQVRSGFVFTGTEWYNSRRKDYTGSKNTVKSPSEVKVKM